VHKYSSTGTSPAVGTTNQRGSLRTYRPAVTFFTEYLPFEDIRADY